MAVNTIVRKGPQLNPQQINQKGNGQAILDSLKQFGASRSTESELCVKISKVMLRDIGVLASPCDVNNDSSEKHR